MATMSTESEMRRAYVVSLRRKLDLTQQELASSLGMSVRAYSDIETGISECRQIHMLAVERITLQQAKIQGDPTLVAAPVLHEIRALIERGL